ncbi:hypothetical protein BDV25DRAFT_145205 [Aspergillus avenaceus]|uniref:Sds3-like-domain-containing protein n=1 Tax=Aspergillus avenaceus TaxID=36643 RepID=A0A5N6TEY1_ASPAV|nr:hypothetical protein BDV25DRAFT_145205 [Aspergillus avenaceus]
MAGVKRKLEAAKGPSTLPTGSAAAVGAPSKTQNPTSGHNTHIRVTRSFRASQDARANQAESQKNNMSSPINRQSSNNRPLSRIITLSTRAARANSAARNALNNTDANTTSNTPARETRASRTRAAVPTTTSSQFDGTSMNVPETPRSKRIRRGPAAEETPRSTRQSARLRSHVTATANDNAFSETDHAIKQHEASPSKGTTSSNRSRNRSRQIMDSSGDTTLIGANTSPVTAMKSPCLESLDYEDVEERKDTEAGQEPSPDIGPFQDTEETTKGTVANDERNSNKGVESPVSERMPSLAKTPGSSELQKRALFEADKNGTPELMCDVTSPDKKMKLEDGFDSTPGQPLRSGISSKTASHSPDDVAEVSKPDNDPRENTEDIEGSATENALEPIAGKTFRGGRNRGRGRGGRSRAAARFASGKRGRGGTRAARGGRTGRQYDRSSDIEHDRSPSPSAATQKLRDRQRELDKAFRKVAAAQRLALAVLASQSQKKLARDKNVHMNVPEYQEVELLLDARLNERLEAFRHEYELRVAQENRLYAANLETVRKRFEISTQHIQDEHYYASQGEYMAFVEGRRAAEDDEHTETDDSETEPERLIPPAREVVRGFNSSFVRNPAGAAAYDRARYGWDDFVQRAKLGDDIDPQMKEMREAGPFAGCSAHEIVGLLLEATGIVEVRQRIGSENHFISHFPDTRPTALSALADAAAAELPRPTISQNTSRLAPHRVLLPQPQVAHGPTDPRSFVLPPPTPQRQQPRRLLPASQQIPPISEQLGLPDPFASRSGPPQLPPPPGSNFQRPPLPGYLAGHHQPGLYYPPPGPRPPY